MSLKNILAANEAARSRKNRKWLLACEIQAKHKVLVRLREAQHAAWGVLGTLQGDMATYFCERDIDLMYDEEADLNGELRDLIARYDTMKP